MVPLLIILPYIEMAINFKDLGFLLFVFLVVKLVSTTGVNRSPTSDPTRTVRPEIPDLNISLSPEGDDSVPDQGSSRQIQPLESTGVKVLHISLTF